MYNNQNPIKNVDEIFPRLLTLPLHPDLKEVEVIKICRELKKFIKDEIYDFKKK